MPGAYENRLRILYHRPSWNPAYGEMSGVCASLETLFQQACNISSLPFEQSLCGAATDAYSECQVAEWSRLLPLVARECPIYSKCRNADRALCSGSCDRVSVPYRYAWRSNLVLFLLTTKSVSTMEEEVRKRRLSMKGPADDRKRLNTSGPRWFCDGASNLAH